MTYTFLFPVLQPKIPQPAHRRTRRVYEAIVDAREQEAQS